MRLFYMILEALIVIGGGGLMLAYANYHDPFQVGVVMLVNIIYLRSWKARSDILTIGKFLVSRADEQRPL